MLTLSAPEGWLAVGIGWSLLHVLWQGSFLAIVLAVALRAVRSSPATTRYALLRRPRDARSVPASDPRGDRINRGASDCNSSSVCAFGDRKCFRAKR